MQDAELLTRVKAYVSEIRNEIGALRNEEHEFKQLARVKETVFEKRWLDIRKRCPHVDTTHHSDPSGNNDSGSKCNDCGVWV